jgi:hypothetical protein
MQPGNSCPPYCFLKQVENLLNQIQSVNID